MPGYTTPPIPYPSPTNTPTVVAPTTAPQSVYTPVLLQPTEQVQKEVTGGSLPGNPTVTLVV
ncbi:MAG: hypothetical protein EBY56_05890, partial [Actinobacteria bacterium]|nr:hypothetical protein [Actinomycetota bacterium]